MSYHLLLMAFDESKILANIIIIIIIQQKFTRWLSYVKQQGAAGINTSIDSTGCDQLVACQSCNVPLRVQCKLGVRDLFNIQFSFTDYNSCVFATIELD